MNKYAQEIKDLQSQVKKIKKEIESLSEKYSTLLKDKNIPLMERWLMLMEHPNYNGVTVNYSDDFKSPLLQAVYDELLCIIELGGSTEYVKIQDAFNMLVISGDGTILKSKLAELGEFSEKDVHNALEEVFERQISYVAL